MMFMTRGVVTAHEQYVSIKDVKEIFFCGEIVEVKTEDGKTFTGKIDEITPHGRITFDCSREYNSVILQKYPSEIKSIEKVPD